MPYVVSAPIFRGIISRTQLLVIVLFFGALKKSLMLCKGKKYRTV